MMTKMHENNCVDNFDRIDNDNVRMHFFVRIQQRKHLKTGKYLEVHAQITNQKKFCTTQKYLDFI